MGERPPVLIGERVLWLGSGSGLPKGGKVKWIGRLPEMGPHWAVGIELDEPLPYGGIDGTWGKRKLFKCRHKHGLIVPHSSIIPQPQQSTRDSAHKRTRTGEFSEPAAPQPQGTLELVPNKSGNKVGKLFRALSNDESRAKDLDLELPSTHLRNPNLQRQLAILGTLRRSDHTDSGRLEGFKSEACLYSVILEKEENVFRERRRMMHGREFKRSDDTLDRTSSINSSRSSGSRRDRSSGIFSFLRWFKKERNDNLELESPESGSPVLQRASGSITGSIDTLFSTATTRSFSFVPPSHYRPYGSANPPEIRICPGPETNTYKNRIRQRDLLRQSERNVSLREKYRLYASETLPRSVDRINEITEVLNQKGSESKNSTIRRQKRPAPPPPIVKNNSSSERDLTTTIAREENYNCDSRHHRRTLSEPSPTRHVKPCHVKGKRKAPQPPLNHEQPGPSDRTLSLQRRKRRAPPPPIQRSPSDEITDIFRQAVDEISGSNSSLSHLETASTASTIDISQAEIIATDTLKLERGYLRPNREEKQMEVRYTPTSPVSPRPWYKRNAASRENSFSRSNERKKERDKRRVEDWMIESGIPRRPNHLPENRFNIFAKTDKTDEKRRSQISILTNISELDREAAEIVRKNKEKQQALLANQNNQFYEEDNFRVPTNEFFNPGQSSLNLRTNGDVVTLFNSITNVTNVTVNSAYFLQNVDLGKSERNHGDTALGNGDKVNHSTIDGQEITITEIPIVTEPDQEPGPSGVGRIAKVTIEELDDFDKERNSRAQALYEANRLQRHQSPPIPTIAEVSESTMTSPASTVANTPSDHLPPPMPGPSASPQEVSLSKPESGQASLPASALRPVVHVVWNCPRCTLENPRWKITCDACDMWRPVPCDFKEVSPKHPLPLAVLRIVEPKDKPLTSEITASKLASGSQSQNGTTGNDFHAKSRDTRSKNNNFNIKEEKTKKSGQGLTISDLLFNTKGSLTPKENHKDILNGLDFPNKPNSSEHFRHVTNEYEFKDDAKKPLNTNQQALSNETSPSGSGSSISSMSSSNSDKPAVNELQRSPKRDVIEPEEIRKARLAFFEKFILPTTSVTSKPSNDINSANERKQRLTEPSKLYEPKITPNSLTSSKGNNMAPISNVHAAEVGTPQLRQVSMQQNERKPLEENQDAALLIEKESTNRITKSNGFEAQPQWSKKLKSETNVQDEHKAKDSQTSTDFPCKSTVLNNQEEDKKKLCEMLIEMKHSLPKRTKEEKRVNQSKKTTDGLKMVDGTVNKSAHVIERNKESPRLGAIRKSIPGKAPQETGIDFKHEPSNQSEAYLVESETIVEEIRMKKPSDKSLPSVQTSAVGQQISPRNKPPIGKEVIVPIRVEEYTIKDGVLYTSVSKGAKKIGTGTFQLMRPRDFANVEAIKTRKKDNDSPLYANLIPSPTESIKLPEGVSKGNSKEVEKLSLQLTEPQGLEHFRAGLANNDTNNMNTIAVNRLLRRLECAIANGQHELAASLAKELAQMKVNCVVTRQKPETPMSRTIIVDMFVEDKETHQGPYPLKLRTSDTVENLKLKVEREYEIPCGVQRWIIGKVLANDDQATLESLGITVSGSTVFLYLVVPEDSKLPAEKIGGPFNELEGAVGGDALKSNLSGPNVENYNNGDVLQEDNRIIRTSNVKTAIPTPQKTTEPAVQNMEPGLPQHPSISEWKCRVCTLVNGSAHAKCAACGLEQPNRYDTQNEPSAQVNRSNGPTKENNKFKAAEDEKKQDYQKLVDLEKSDLIMSTEAFECPVCLVEYKPLEGVVLRECLHVFCRACLANTVEYSDEAEVKCPFRDENYTCDSSLLEREIKALVTPEAYEQHLAKSIALAETKIGNTFHCKTPDCKGWCIFEDNVNLFRCPVCTHTNCLTCQAVHEGLDCKQFQEQISKDSEVNVESKRTKEMLQEMVDRGEAMNCPTCQVVLMKKWGCDWLRCSMCKTEICWITRGPRWGPNGKGDTSGGCQCGVNGVKCHPKCTYCH